MSNSIKVLGISLGVFLLMIRLDWKVASGFSFDGSAVPCQTVNITGNPKMKTQYEECKKSTFEDFKKRGESMSGFGPMLCTALCAFKQDKLVDIKTGKLVENNLSKYKDVFEHIPNLVRKNITDVFYKCFQEHKTDNVYNTTHPHDCSGVMYVGLCIKAGIDEVCNPSPPEDE